jgi:outer membrane protein insertion porin family
MPSLLRAGRALLAVCVLVGSQAAMAQQGAPPLSRDAPPTVVEVIVHAPARFTEKELSTTRAQVGIVAGSVLSRDAVRDAVERLYATGQFADVVVSARPSGVGVALTFDLPAQRRITAFTFHGPPSEEKPVLTKVALAALERDRPGHAASLPVAYFPEQLEVMREAVQANYQERGFESAKVSALEEVESESEVAVVFSIEQGPATRIAAITASGSPGLSPGVLEAALGLALGDVLDRSAVEHGLKQLRLRYRKEHAYRAQVGAPRVVHRQGEPERAELVIPVEAGPEIRFHFHGNNHFDARVLLAKMGFSEEESFDEGEEERLAARVRAFYVLNGFFDAHVVPQEVFNADRSKLVVIFDIDEGQPLKVKRVQFDGNHHFDNNFLVDRVHESLREQVPLAEDVSSPVLEEGEAALPGSDSETRAALYHPDPNSVFAEGAYKDALGRIVDLYKADGFLDVSVDLPRLEVDEDARTAVVYVPVVEGPQTFITGLRIEGVAEVEPLRALVTLPLGKPFNTVEEENSRLAIARSLQQQGFLFARVTDAELFDEGHTQVTVVYKIVTGPRVRVRSIIVRGNENTREGVVRAGLELVPGDIFDEDKVEESEHNLAALGIFTRVEVHALDPDHEDVEKDLVVDVDERPRTDITASLGGSLVDGPRAFLEANRANLFGLGLEATLQAKVNYFNLSYPVLGSGQLQAQSGIQGFGGHVTVGLRDPRIFFFQPAQVAAHLDLVAERINRPAYRFNREAAILGLDWLVTRWLAASLVNTVEADNVRKQKGLAEALPTLSATDVQNLRFGEGVTYLYAVTPALTVDRRDNAANPHSGFLISVSTELAHDLGGSTYNPRHNDYEPVRLYYAKPVVAGTVYLPLGKHVTFALSARAGRVFPLESDSETIAPKRFYLGGASTLRGYPEDGLTPEDLRATYRSDVDNCRRLVTGAGCSEASRILNSGVVLPSAGGQAFVLYKGELRFPISGNFEGALFLDAGDLWADPTLLSLRPGDLKLTPGVGLRYGTPVGPIALDVGFNPIPDTKLNEAFFSTRYVQFSIGLF